MAFIFDIKRFSINDGPGVRITVFFKGCSLNCRWCHNPESISFKTEKLYNKSKCIACGSCVETCPEKALVLTETDRVVTDFSKCTMCGICAEVCPTNAMEMSGRDYPEEEIMNTILRETHVMDVSGGGVTFSGGEPLMYPNELKSLLIRCGDEGVHRAVDTAGYVKSSVVEDIMPYTDLFLYDLKIFDREKHKQWTGAYNDLPLQNLKLISENDKEFHIRIPLIEGVNCDDNNISDSLSFLESLKNRPSVVSLLPYHKIAISKFERLGRSYNENGMAKPSDEKVDSIREIFLQKGYNVNIGG